MIFITSTASYAEEKSKCIEDNECIQVVGICNQQKAISKSHIDSFYEGRNKVAATMFCNKYVSPKWNDNLQAVCKNKMCKLQLKDKRKLSVSTDNEKQKIDQIYKEIQINQEKGEYRKCFYQLLELKNYVPIYEKSEEIFLICKQNIK